MHRAVPMFLLIPSTDGIERALYKKSFARVKRFLGRTLISSTYAARNICEFDLYRTTTPRAPRVISIDASRGGGEIRLSIRE